MEVKIPYLPAYTAFYMPGRGGDAASQPVLATRSRERVVAAKNYGIRLAPESVFNAASEGEGVNEPVMRVEDGDHPAIIAVRRKLQAGCSVLGELQQLEKFRLPVCGITVVDQVWGVGQECVYGKHRGDQSSVMAIVESIQEGTDRGKPLISTVGIGHMNTAGEKTFYIAELVLGRLKKLSRVRLSELIRLNTSSSGGVALENFFKKGGVLNTKDFYHWGIKRVEGDPMHEDEAERWGGFVPHGIEIQDLLAIAVGVIPSWMPQVMVGERW